MENKIKNRLPKATNYELCCLDVINGIKWMGWMNEWMKWKYITKYLIRGIVNEMFLLKLQL